MNPTTNRDDPPTTDAPLLLGWEEWLELPDLNLPAIKAKVDTGARTSALHAFLIEPFGDHANPMVRFGIHPVPGRDDIEIYCVAPVIGRRTVTSSNGERETRYVIETNVGIGDRRWPIEVTLTNRESMSYRMLLGRQAIRSGVRVDPTGSFRQPKRSYKLYKQVAQSSKREPARRPLRIALVASKPRDATSRTLEEAARRRGHTLERLDSSRIALVIDRMTPHLSIGSERLAHYDAVLPLFAPEDGAYGAAIVRQLEIMGSYAINTGDALERCQNALTVLQHLARHGLAIQRRAVGPCEPVTSLRPIRTGQPRLRCLIVGGDVAATMLRSASSNEQPGDRKRSREVTLAREAAVALGLHLASIDIVAGDDGPEVARVSPVPALSVYETVTRTPVADTIIRHLERQLRPVSRALKSVTSGFNPPPVAPD